MESGENAVLSPDYLKRAFGRIASRKGRDKHGALAGLHANAWSVPGTVPGAGSPPQTWTLAFLAMPKATFRNR